VEIASYPVVMQASKILALIPARGGSKGLPRKNVLPAGGKPLIAWTVEAALSSKCVSRVVLSSDDDEIIAAAKAAGCEVPFRRPPELAGDNTSAMDVVFHALDNLPGYEYIVLLQPTSPLRLGSDIDGAVDLLKIHKAPSCVSVSEVDQSPYWMYNLNAHSILSHLIDPIHKLYRRQDLPPTYILNGAIYIAKVDWLLLSRSFIGKETVGYVMPKSRSIDIDDAVDFQEFKRIVEFQDSMTVLDLTGHN
jgi:CMP-N,N'-diacetyllegionaminic acid synthase